MQHNNNMKMVYGVSIRLGETQHFRVELLSALTSALEH